MLDLPQVGDLGDRGPQFIDGVGTDSDGLRTESEYVPSMATGDPEWENAKPIYFHFNDKLAPRVGAVYDVLGDSSLKVFASFARRRIFSMLKSTS